MPDNHSNRGPHPEDHALFAAGVTQSLRRAAADYLWLLNRGYPDASSLKLVGDRYRLAKRQRNAVARSVCSDEAMNRRQVKQITAEQVEDRLLLLDGFNVLVTIEASLAGGVLLCCRDGTLRDMSSMHGTYRKTAGTIDALTCVGKVMQELHFARCRWLFDQPVSNSGRVVAAVRQVASDNGWPWEAETVADPDRELSQAVDPIATADSIVLDRCQHWFNLARYVVERTIPGAWMIDFGDLLV